MEVKKQIGYLPEQPPLYLEMTVGEYLGFVANIKKVARKGRRDCPGRRSWTPSRSSTTRTG